MLHGIANCWCELPLECTIITCILMRGCWVAEENRGALLPAPVSLPVPKALQGNGKGI